MEGKYCTNCAYRIVVEKRYRCIQGIGNRYNKRIIVLPSLKYKNKTIEDNTTYTFLNELYNRFYGKALATDYYITAFIKCPCDRNYPINRDILKQCVNYFIEEMNANDYNKIILLGNTGEYLIDKKPNNSNIMYSFIDNRHVTCCYSPNLQNKNSNVIKLFVTKIRNTFDAFNSNDYSKFQIINS